MAHSHQKGFTLLEMVTVIILLGVISVGVTGFIRFGAQVFVENSERDELISSARFAVERLNRELRAALPNSVRVISSTGIQCLEFIPSVASTIYLDIPVEPESDASSFQVIKFSGEDNVVGLNAVVYPVYANNLYSGASNKIYRVTNKTTPAGAGLTHIREITLSNAIQFEQDSPTKRVFFTESPVSYCVSGGSLTRHQGYTNNGVPNPFANGVLMAENIISASPFNVSQATHERNAVATTTLTFSKNDEQITFNNDVQVINVP